jgi:hypothetical protein
MLQHALVALAAVVIYYGMGYLPRWLAGNHDRGVKLTCEEAVTGFAVIALFCTVSLRLFHTFAYGASLAASMSIACFISAVRKSGFHFMWLKPKTENYISFAFIVMLLLVFAPTFIYGGQKYHLPDIFDLSKHISTLVSLASAKGWPSLNPYYPLAPFAYNVLFYTPLACLSRLSGAPASFNLIIFAVTSAWVAWSAIQIFKKAFSTIGIHSSYHLIGVLFLTFAGGLTPFFVETNIPMGFTLHLAKGVNVWPEDPFTYFIYIPQHVFSVVCFMSAWIFMYKSIDFYLKTAVISVLMAAAVMSSFILAPIMMFCWGIMVCYLVYERYILPKRFSIADVCIFLGASSVFAIVIPFILETVHWAGNTERPSISLPHLDMSPIYIIATVGPVSAFAGVGLMDSVFRKRDPKWILFSVFICIPLLISIFVTYPDSGIKSVMMVRFMLVVPACYGFSILDQWAERNFGGTGALVVYTPVFLSILLSTILIGYYITSPYQELSEEKKDVIVALRGLTPAATVLLADPDQELAALSGRLVYMDYSSYRVDRYLPVTFRKDTETFFSSTRPEAINEGDGLKHIDYVVAEKSAPQYRQWLGEPIISGREAALFKVIRPERLSLVFSLADVTWEPWSGTVSKSLKFNASDHEVCSEEATDASLVAKTPLHRGVYLLDTTITGTTNDSTPYAHISLHGKKKILSITGEAPYFRKSLKASFFAEEGDRLEFGLGGWGTGSGRIALESLRIFRVPE